MRKEVKWLTDALSEKNIAREMTHYRIGGREIKATDGRITAGHPWPTNEECLVPGSEFEKLLARLPGDPTLEVGDNCIILKSGRSRGTINTMPTEEWGFPGVDTNRWENLPEGLTQALRKLRPFVSDNATKQWALGVALDDGWAYATNNVALAGVPLPSIAGVQAILPMWAIEFILDRTDELVEWAWTEQYVGFRWSNGAWMRSQLINDRFHEKAAEMIRSVDGMEPPQVITDEFRAVYARVAGLVGTVGGVYIGPQSIKGGFGQATMEDGVDVETLEGVTAWAAAKLTPVIAAATHWEPATWPKPTPWKGDGICGYIIGRNE